MMPEKLYGSTQKDVIALVENTNDPIVFADSLTKMVLAALPDTVLVQKDDGDCFVEMIEHEGNKYYYLIHSEEVMKIRSERDNLQHARYSLVD